MKKTVMISAEESAAQKEYIQKVRVLNSAAAKKPLAFIETYGCQQNSSDSERIKGMLNDMGFDFCDNTQDADLVLYNTCAVRENAELRVFGNIGALKHQKRRKPDMIIGVCGCMMQQEHIAETVKKKYPHVSLVFGTHALHRFPELLYGAMNNQRVFDVHNEDGTISEDISYKRDEPPLARIPIMYGCNNFCTYFYSGLLEYPQYSRPEEWNGRRVPEILLSGHHANIAKWRHEQALERTRTRRPDLYEKYEEKSMAKIDK